MSVTITGMRRAGVLSVCSFVLLALFVAGERAASADTHQLIEGSGSSWAADAIDRWIADTHRNGLQVVYSANGSAQGRRDFATNTSDLAVSDLPYQGTDPVSGSTDNSDGRGFAYAPLVGGGIAFPFHIVKNGQLVRTLRLSGDTIAKIFTQRITNWDDPQITSDNNGNAMPNLQIIPVQHAEGSATSYELTSYLSAEHPDVWTAGASQYFPRAQGSAVAENGSDGVMNFLTSDAADGAIGYDEYTYALGADYPVVKLENKAGYYTLPGQYNVAIALRNAVHRTSAGPDLTGVFDNTDSRAYPLSYYSSMIVPTAADDSRMTTAKRQTIVDFAEYALCQGQGEAGQLGNAPLPLNLVQSAFTALRQMHDADPDVDISRATTSSCANPTFTGDPPADQLDTLAPAPQTCDHEGAGPCGLTHPAPAPNAPSVALAGGRHVRAGSIDPLLGRVTRDGKAYTDSTITLYATTDDKQVRRVASARPVSGGRVYFAPRVWRNSRFSLKATFSDEDPSGGGGTVGSPDLPVTAYYGVTARENTSTLRLGQTVTIAGAVTPSRVGEHVVLELLEDGRWAPIGSWIERRLRSSSGTAYTGYVAYYRPVRRGSYRLRVAHADSATNVKGSSPGLTLHVR